MSTTARTKRPTIRDVAAKAGVSKSLVSLVFLHHKLSAVIEKN
jgi:Transcriptional regulators